MLELPATRITVECEGRRYRFARPDRTRRPVRWLVPGEDGRSTWRDITVEEWHALPAAVRDEVCRRFRMEETK